MEVRLTRGPGQTGTKKLVERYGKRLVCVRYRYDAQSGCRHKTVELIVETVLWQPNARRARRRDEEMIAVRIAYAEAELRERAKRLGAIWGRNSACGKCAGSMQSGLESATVCNDPNASGALQLDICRHIPRYTVGSLHPYIDRSSIARMQAKH